MTRDPVSDTKFHDRVSAHPDETYRTDAAFLAAKAEGRVSIRRTSDLLSDIGSRGALLQSMEFYRSANREEQFGGGGTGMGFLGFDVWWAAQTAAGQYMAVGGTDGLELVVGWKA